MINAAAAILASCLIFVSSCSAPRSGIMLVDNDMNPSTSLNQLEVSTERGEVGHVTFARPGSDDAILSYQMTGSKKWIIDHWGSPDAHYKNSSVDYYLFKRRDARMSLGLGQSLNEKNSVKLGFRGNKLVYVETFIERPDPYMKGPVYVLPK